MEVGAAVLEAEHHMGSYTHDDDDDDDDDDGNHAKFTVDMLRVQGSVEFESEAGILPGAPPKKFLKQGLPWFFDAMRFYPCRGSSVTVSPLPDTARHDSAPATFRDCLVAHGEPSEEKHRPSIHAGYDD